MASGARVNHASRILDIRIALARHSGAYCSRASKAFGLFRWEAPNFSMLEVGKGGLPPLLRAPKLQERGLNRPSRPLACLRGFGLRLLIDRNRTKDRANLLIQLRLDPPVRDQPHQRYEYVKPVGNPLMNKG